MLMLASFFACIGQKGNWYIGGVAGFTNDVEKQATGFKTTFSTWAFGPEGGTFLRDDIQLGLALGFVGSSEKNDNGNVQTVSTLSPTVYTRKFFKVTDGLSLFGGFYVNYSNGKTTTYNPTQERTQSGIGLRLGVGLAYSLSPRFTAVGQYGLLGYQSVTYKVAGANSGSSSTFSFGVNTVGGSTLTQGNGSGAVFNIGLYYTLKKK